jgi:hypothetical protein
MSRASAIRATIVPTMPLLLPLLLATTIDGNAALDHARRLAALGPHPWGSTLDKVAAEYVASQFREIGLNEVRLEPFESHGLFGSNVVGILPGPGPEFLVVGAHHDTAPGAPGAYDDGGGAGILIETARVLAKGGERPRKIIFVSWDAEEAFSQRPTTTAGSRAYVAALGSEASQLVAAVAIDMSGWTKGSPCVHPIAYADPLRPGRYAIAPAWLVRTAVTATRDARAELSVGDPLLFWLYQPVVRTFRGRLYGDDISFVQAGLPAVFLSDSSLGAFYPWYHAPGDTADKLDAAALTRMGQAVLAIVGALGREPRRSASEPTWYATPGDVWGSSAVLAIGFLSLVPGLVIASRRGAFALTIRLAYSGFVTILLWRNPVPTVWIFTLPSLVPLIHHRLWTSFFSLAPLLALVAMGGYAWQRGAASGLWFAHWELATMGLALALVWFLPKRRSGSRRRSSERRGLPK